MPYRALLVGALMAVVINTVFPYGLLVMEPSIGPAISSP